MGASRLRVKTIQVVEGRARAAALILVSSNLNDKMKKKIVGEACGTHRETEKFIHGFGEKT